MKVIVPFRSLDRTQIGLVGGKNANLGELVQHLSAAGVRVPGGFALTADAFRRHLRKARIDEAIFAELDGLDLHDVAALARTGAAIRQRVRAAALPPEVEGELRAAYDALSRQYGEDATDVAVRSSATAEDLPDASFAGQQESYLNVRGHAALIDAVRNCMASLFTDRAIVYRAERGFSHRAVALSVGVQKMVRSDLASAGVIFTLDPETGFRDVVHINGSWGLGETVVKGQVNPDEITIHKPLLARGFRAIVRRDIGDKAIKLVYAEGASTAREPVPESDRVRSVLTDEEALSLARWSVAIEAHYGVPMDIEWAKDGRSNQLFIVQARPETVHARAHTAALEVYRLETKHTPKLVGKSVGAKVAVGHEARLHGTEPKEYFIDRLALGVARIAAGFYPRPVIVRFSDFKTNEYANLLGGKAFEPTEANPMIGFRGASRYYDPRYRDGFALECAAIKRRTESSPSRS